MDDVLEIDRTIAAGRQSVNFAEVLDIRGDKFKISIKSDDYSFQSHARISRWNGEEWKLVHSIHHGNMQTPTGLAYVHGNQTALEPFTRDRDKLISIAKQIVF